MSSQTRMDKNQVIWITRHGNRIDFVEQSWQGTDPHLSPDGVVQAKQTGARLRDEAIEHIFASPFLRTIETAHHIADVLDLPIKIEYGVCEWLNPKWFAQAPRYLSPNERRRCFSRVDEQYASMVRPEVPETREQLNTRCRETALLLVQHYPSHILIVGHAASSIALTQGLVESYGDMEFESFGLCALTKINKDHGHATLELNADVSHLSTTTNTSRIN